MIITTGRSETIPIGDATRESLDDAPNPRSTADLMRPDRVGGRSPRRGNGSRSRRHRRPQRTIDQSSGRETLRSGPVHRRLRRGIRLDGRGEGTAQVGGARINSLRLPLVDG